MRGVLGRLDGGRHSRSLTHDKNDDEDRLEKTVPLFEVKAGGIEIADGVYPVILTAIAGPKLVTAQQGPNAGKEIELFDWTYAIDAPGTTEDGLEITASTSTASGPKSKMFSWLTALMGGKPPAVGTKFETQDLVGRAALATIRTGESGWPRLENLGAMPAAMLGQRVAAATGAPTGSSTAVGGMTMPVGAGAQPTPDLPF